jgi:hypothetical protein
VKSNRLPPETSIASAQPEAPRAGIVQAWNAFWFTPANPTGLHALRVLGGLLILTWLLSYWGQQEAFFGLNGWFDRQAYLEASRLQDLPTPIGWSVLYLAGTDATLLNAMYYAALAIVALFTLGVATRITAILTWVVVVSFAANPAIGYDADALLGILAFYLMIGYVLLGQWGRPQSLAGRLLGNRDTFLFSSLLWGRESRPAAASHAANLALRLFQVHFALVVVTSGLHKLQFGEYWGGVALWFPLNPPLEVTQETLRRQAANIPTRLFFLSLAQYAVLAWQIAFPLFAWRKRWRVLLLGGAVVAWLGSAFLYRLPLFGPLYFLFCLSYLTPAEWQWISSFGRGMVNWFSPSGRAGVEKAEKARPQRLRTH